MLSLGRGAPCDLSVLIDTRMLVQCNSGGGKSWLLRRLLEQSHGKVQQLVIDPEGEFSTLREKFDYVLAAKQGGDTSADPRTAKLLAERLLELGASAILDIYELKAHERIRFVRLFLEALVDAPKKLWHPVLIVLDEGHVYAPQKGEAESAPAVIDCATRGRKRGFCLVVATQRLSKLHKDAAAELNNKLIGRTGLDVDRARAAEELGFTSREQQHALRSLEPGSFFCFGPALSPDVREVRVGNVQTTHPKAGARLAFDPPPPTAKIKKLLPKLADLPAEQEHKAQTEGELRKELSETKHLLTLAQKGQATKEKVVEKVTTIDRLVITKDQLAAIKDGAKKLGQLEEEIQQRVDWLDNQVLRPFLAVLQLNFKDQKLPVVVEKPGKSVTYADIPARPAKAIEIKKVYHSRLDPRLTAISLRERRAALERTPFSAEADRRMLDSLTRTSPIVKVFEKNGNLSGPEQRILNAIAWMESIGVNEPEQTAVAFLAGYKAGGGAFNNPRARLNQKFLVRYLPGEKICLTEQGWASAEIPEGTLDTAQLHAKILDRLPGPEGKILRVLLDAHPETLSNEECASRANYAIGGAYNNPRSRLRSLGLIEYVNGGVRARDILFL